MKNIWIQIFLQDFYAEYSAIILARVEKFYFKGTLIFYLKKNWIISGGDKIRNYEVKVNDGFRHARTHVRKKN